MSQQAPDVLQLQKLYTSGDYASLKAICLKRILSLPNDCIGHEYLAHCEVHDDNYENAIQHFILALSGSPQNTGLLINIGSLNIKVNKLEAAKFYLSQALTIAPDLPTVNYLMGEVNRAAGNLDEAKRFYFRTLELDSLDANANFRLIRLMIDEMNIESAEKLIGTMLKNNPHSAEALGLRAELQRSCGLLEESLNTLRRGLEYHNSDRILAMLYLYTLNFCHAYSADYIFREHIRLANKAFPSSTKKTPLRLSGNKKIRIGFVSPDFRGHSVAYFSEALYTRLNRNSFEIYSYYNHFSNDKMTMRFRNYSDGWLDTRHLSTDRICAHIQESKIDILIDLAGHTLDNRLDVFARSPAPVSLTYLGYPNTTGLSAIDYRLTDALSEPGESAAQLYSEKLVFIDRCFLCYTPPDNSPSTKPAPFLKRGHITFGSFNAQLKINEFVLGLWKKILEGVPDARLAIKTHTNTTPAFQEFLFKRCETAGLDISRVDILPTAREIADHLGVYNFIDIALDTYPYHGTTTTCEALWMGVPVITLCGDRHANMVGKTILTNAGVPELITHNAHNYVNLAINLANDHNKLIEYHSVLRQKVSASPLFDQVGFSNSFENALLSVLN